MHRPERLSSSLRIVPRPFAGSAHLFGNIALPGSRAGTITIRNEIRRPARFSRPARTPRRVEAHPRRGRPAARDDRDLRSRAAAGRARAAVRAAERVCGVGRACRHAGPRQPLRHGAARRAGNGRGIGRGAARSRQAARVPEGAGTAEGVEGRLAEHAAGVHAGDADGAEGAFVGPVPGHRLGRRGRRSRAAAGADLLAGRRRSADHLGAHRHARPAQDAAEPRHLPAAGDRAEQGDHALARASRWRAGLPRPCGGNARCPVSGRGRAGRRSGDDPRRRHAGAGHVVGIPVRGAAPRFAHRDREMPDPRAFGAGVRRDRARRLHPARCERSDRIRNGRRGSVRRPHGLLQRGRALPGVDARPDHDAPRSDLSLDLHRQAARRAVASWASR